MRGAVQCGARLMAAAALLGAATPLRAAAETGPARAWVIAGDSTCPEPGPVWSELVTLIPTDRLEARLRALSTVGPPAIQILDLGAAFRIAAAGRERVYRDPPRDCANRARIAALFVALAIDPAVVLPEPVPATPEAAASRVVPAAPEPTPALPDGPRPARLRFELAAALDAGGGEEDRVVQVGVDLRAVIGRGRLAVEAGVSALAPADTNVGGLRVRQWRIPLDIGVRAAPSAAGRRLIPYLELGLAVALLSERGLDLATSRADAGVEVGARLALGARLATRGRVGPFAALTAELVPDPPTFFALPVGSAGHTPYLWLGALAGASWGPL